MEGTGPFLVLNLYGVFLMHVPPGVTFCQNPALWASMFPAANTKSSLYAEISSDVKKYLSKLRDKEMPEILKQLYGINIYVCKSCGGHLGKPQLRIPQRC